MAPLPAAMSRWRRPILLLGFVSLALGGCGATGLDWAAEAPLEPSSERMAESRINPSAAGPASIPVSTDPDPTADARPRLSHTVTLGEVNAVPPVARAPAIPTGTGVSVTVNNYNSVSRVVPAYGSSGVGYGSVTRSVSVGNAPRSGSSSTALALQPGQNWPAVPDYGSSFPYRSAPASPWARTR